MIINCERTGGFSGIKLRREINTAKLPITKAKKVEYLAAKLLNNDLGDNRKACDQFQYKLKIDGKAVELNEHNADIGQLIHCLMDAAVD